MTTASLPIEPALPRLSVVLPVCNEAEFIARTLDSVLGQDYPPDLFEVLVADGRSEDATREIVTRAAERVSREASGVYLELIDNPGRLMSTGTNAAIRCATGDVIVLLGGHAWLPPHYLRTCVSALLKSEADVVGGAIESVGVGWMGEAIAAALSSPFGIGNSSFRTTPSGDPFEVDTVALGAYRLEVFERVGLFNPHMVRHQRYEFNHRVRESGGQILLLPELRAVFHVRESLAALARRYWQNGVWKGRFLRRFPESVRMRHLLPSVFALTGALSVLAVPILPPFMVLLATWLGAYLGFMGAALGSFALRGKWRVLPVMPAVLACLHLSYGLGVWVGLSLPRLPDAPRLDPA